MLTDLGRCIDANGKLKNGSSFLVVPIIPTVGMMMAAADARDVFVSGDRLADWLLTEEAAIDGEAAIDPALVERFGRASAFELSVMAEFWAGCIDGLDEWSSRRAVQGSDHFIDSWFTPVMDTCPAGGWPESKALCMSSHLAHAASFRALPPFSCDTFPVRSYDMAVIRPAPRRCASIMALRAGQRELLFDHVFSVVDTVDFTRLPYVPGLSIEHRMDDEERHHLMAAAAWRGAVAWLLDPGRTALEPMPLSPVATSVFLSRLVYHHVERATTLVEGYHGNGPYTRAVVKSDESELVLEGRGCDLHVRYSHRSGRRYVAAGHDVRLPWVKDDLMRLAREFSSQANVTLDVESTLNA